ncbi:hypothetical protein SS50377_28386 [Spironucleus salmonicida]|uniref:BPI-like protein n=1 Tax=Spironucleus salmonicida TaxID=348837 RepID=V6M7W5_9EUKA|nr:hypothetical protein SS50377_28386 [Spironucleus salmonicida]|eukprot:EST49569.1 hypothetical protein SS50377_10069 [Spironucleus salmonicida]
MLVLLLQATCQPIGFDIESPTLADAAMRVFVTKQGIERYCTRNIKNAIGTIQGSLSAIEVNYAVAGIGIQLKNGRIIEIELNNMSVFLHSSSSTIKVSDVLMNIIFELKLEQKTYPYLYDTGTMQLEISDFTISTLATVEIPDECKNKYKIATRQTIVSVDDFKIQFKSNYEVLLNSISVFLTSYLKDLLNGSLGQDMGQKLMDALMKLLIEQTYLPRMSYKQYVGTDQRYFNGLEIGENFIMVNSTGQRCLYQHPTKQHCKGNLDEKVTTPLTYFTNHHVQYQIEKLAFNSGFKLYLEEERKIDNIIIKNITLVKFHNTGAKVEVTLDVGGASHTLTYLEPVVFGLERIKDNVDFGRFGVRLTNLISNSTLTSEQLKSLADYFDSSYPMYDIAYASALGVSAKRAEVVYLDANWIHIGSFIE